MDNMQEPTLSNKQAYDSVIVISLITEQKVDE